MEYGYLTDSYVSPGQFIPVLFSQTSDFWLVIAKQKTTVNPFDNVLLQSFEKVYFGFQELKILNGSESVGCPSALRGFYSPCALLRLLQRAVSSPLKNGLFGQTLKYFLMRFAPLPAPNALHSRVRLHARGINHQTFPFSRWAFAKGSSTCQHLMVRLEAPETGGCGTGMVFRQ